MQKNFLFMACEYKHQTVVTAIQALGYVVGGVDVELKHWIRS